MPMLAEQKKRTVRINGCVASAQAAKYADVDVIAAYPIRPYTATMMALAQMVANGELDAEYIVADSEHSQLSIAHGASSSGARVFTGSSGVGVQFAYELYSPISGSRMPVQMMIADRTLDPPGDFGSEHTDALSTRDMGWLMGWSCDAQEAFDNHLLAYRIGEDRQVLLPQMVCQDGFFVSHITSDVELPDPGQVKEFLPPYTHPYPLDLRHPVSHGPQIMPEQGPPLQLQRRPPPPPPPFPRPPPPRRPAPPRRRPSPGRRRPPQAPSRTSATARFRPETTPGRRTHRERPRPRSASRPPSRCRGTRGFSGPRSCPARRRTCSARRMPPARPPWPAPTAARA